MHQSEAAKLPKNESEFRKLQREIKIIQKQIPLDDGTYREMLFNQTGKRSTTEMDIGDLRRVLVFLNGEKHQHRKAFPGKPRDFNDSDKHAMYTKIEAMLAEAKRPWAYAHAMAKNMFKIDRLEFCRYEQTHKIVQAMMMDAKRHGRRTE